MTRSRKRTFRRNAAAKSLASGRFRQRIVRNRKIYTRKGRRPTDSGLSSWGRDRRFTRLCSCLPWHGARRYLDFVA